MIKKLIKGSLARAGLKVSRIPAVGGPPDLDSQVAATLPASECYARFTSACPIFQPWLGYGDFAAAYDGVAVRTLVSPDRCYVLQKFAQATGSLEGDFIECGVFKGGTALLLARTLPPGEKKLWLFDSFEGLPESSRPKGDFYQKGDFNQTSYESVRELLNPFANRLSIRKGWIPESFTGLDGLRFAFAHIDVDLYKPALACCEYIFPRLVQGGVMIFDDYGYPACRGERNAVDLYFSQSKTPVIALPTGQALVIKNTP